MRSESHQAMQEVALRALRLGQHRVALSIYYDLLNLEIDDLVGIHLQISGIQGILGNIEEQNQHVLMAYTLAPTDPRVLLDYGSYLFRLDDLSGARHFFEQVSGESVLESRASGNLAAIAIREGNSELADFYLEKAFRINPNNDHALDLGLTLLGERIGFTAVIDCFLNQHRDTDPSLLFLVIGKSLDKAGCSEDALDWLKRSIEVDPASVISQLERSHILCRLGRLEEAIEQLMIALTIEPEHIELLFSMGYCLQHINQVESAIYFYERILAIEPAHSEASNLLGCCHRHSAQEDQAIAIFRAALERDPGHKRLLANLASALCNIGRIEESLSICKQSLDFNPVDSEAFYSYMFTLSILPKGSSAEMLSAAKDFWHAYREMLIGQNAHWVNLSDRRMLSSQGQIRIPDCTSSGNSKIRVGILSVEVGAHVVGMFLRTFLQHYDRSSFCVTLIIGHRRYEVQENELVAMADDVLSLQGLNTFAAAKAISDQQFDVILETSGYTRNTQLHLLCFRLAPVQCHYIGYHASTGLDTIDYFFGDAITTPPDSEDSFSEILWRLPDTWLAISYHEQLPEACSLSQVTAFTFGSFNQGAKFNQATFVYWSSALKAVPDSILLIKDRSLTSATRREWICESLETLGISRSRLRLLGATSSWQDHMSIYNVVDACLDCTFWSGSTTVFDSLSMGTPYISILGETMASRMSSSILAGYGYPDWIARSASDYADIARRMADQLEFLREGKQAMQSRVLSLAQVKARLLTGQVELAMKHMTASALAKL